MSFSWGSWKTLDCISKAKVTTPALVNLYSPLKHATFTDQLASPKLLRCFKLILVNIHPLRWNQFLMFLPGPIKAHFNLRKTPCKRNIYKIAGWLFSTNFKGGSNSNGFCWCFHFLDWFESVESFQLQIVLLSCTTTKKSRACLLVAQKDTIVVWTGKHTS